MSEEHSIPDALLEAVAELNRDVDHIAAPVDPLQPLENALQLYGQQREEHSAERQVQPAEEERQVQPAEEEEEQPAGHQHGGSRVQNDAVTRREQFNNFEKRQVFNIPSPDDAADLAQFYLEVRDNFVDLAGRVRQEVSRNDRV
ncbi:RE1-silencing transcription factor [Sarotherodon galilaeus]